MRVAVPIKMDNGQISNKEKFKMTINKKKFGVCRNSENIKISSQ